MTEQQRKNKVSKELEELDEIEKLKKLCPKGFKFEGEVVEIEDIYSSVKKLKDEEAKNAVIRANSTGVGNVPANVNDALPNVNDNDENNVNNVNNVEQIENRASAAIAGQD